MNENERYIKEIRSRLSDYRFNHSLNVADTARALAEKYGADPEKAYTAGILHDILKDMPKDELFEYTLKCFPCMTQLERVTPKLWHAMAGSEFIRRELAVVDSEIISAVRRHTTGCAGMSTLEKVLFIADFISADREYDGVERMREKAKISLETAMEEGLQFTVCELCGKLSPVHPDTLEAYNEIVLKGKVL